MTLESWDTLFLFNSYTATSSPPGKLSTLLLGLLGWSCCSFEAAEHSMQICKHHMQIYANETEDYFASVYAHMNSFFRQFLTVLSLHTTF